MELSQQELAAIINAAVLQATGVPAAPAAPALKTARPDIYHVWAREDGSFVCQIERNFQGNDPAIGGNGAMSQDSAVQHVKEMATRLGYDVAAIGEPTVDIPAGALT